MLEPLRRAAHSDLVGGLLLVAAAALAVGWASSPWDAAYDHLWHAARRLALGPWTLDTDLRAVVDDGAMTLFFLLLGLEIRHEVHAGHLTSLRRVAAPALGALGGMVTPAAIFLLCTAGTDGTRGWGIPMATDVAFALAVLALVGPGVPDGVRPMLLTLAVVDDVGAIVVIAVAYSGGLSFGWLAAGVALAAAFGALVRRAPGWWPVAVALGLGAWAATSASGVHPTIAGVALGLLVPPGAQLERTSARLRPWVVLVIVPLFALANAGVALSPGALGDVVTSRLGLGIVVGLVVGKAVGIAGAVTLARRLGWGELPDGVEPRHVLGLATLAGVGFTVSIFVTGLAYDDAGRVGTATLAILLASTVAAVLGVTVLRRASRPR